MTRGALFATVLLAVLPPRPLSAQIRGTVVDEQHHPLGDAVVDLWSPTARLGRVITGPSGAFQFAADPTATRLLVRRIGASPSQRALGAGAGPVEVILAAAPITLPPIRVSGACTGREDRSAREAWESAARWYREILDTFVIETTFKTTHERLLLTEVGRPVIDSTGYGQAGHTAYARRLGEARLKEVGYPAPDPESSEVFTSSMTPSELQHFVSPGFGDRVRFTALEDGRIRFCPKRRDHPWIEGVMAFAEDSSVLWIKWTYGARSEGWATGGLATFASPATDRSVPLVPTSFVLWQERGSGMAAQWSAEFREWTVRPKYGLYLPPDRRVRDTSTAQHP